ncbi:hypothetical protein P5G50_05635 [Leifsonia sp. F6_8S_P_1B]|uniref:Gram-positive cocci surface proteins LPxTG domain-containing protein n=1 Tax=Leifsonia williamsii TaxID=3035919 RepID=A0ABT8K8Z0_9MICO|nr:hypothetical protein [Leifsonia williamsii]MDN4613931.1 hypothetical protein [Leifsonia williamsii]
MDGSRSLRLFPAPAATRGPEGARRRRRRPIIAVIAMLAVLFTVLVPANAAMADMSLPNTDDISWTKTGSTTASGTLPGNLASLPGATLSVSSSQQPVDVAEWGSSTVASHTNGGYDCMRGRALKQITTCETFTYTVTLKTPLIDPIVPFGFSTGRYWSTTESTSRGCISGWYDGALSNVNGSAPTSSSLTTLQEPGGGWAHTGTATWALPQSAIDSNNCINRTTTDQMGMIQLRGKISSYSFTVYYRAAIVIPWTTTVCPLLSAPAGQFIASVLIPQVDLRVQKTGPASVPGNSALTWDITVSNLSQWDSHGFVVKDAVPSSMSNVSIVSAPAGCSVNGRDLVCAIAPPGCSVSQNGSVSTLADISCTNAILADQSVLAPGASSTIRLSATAPATNGTKIANTVTVSGVDEDPYTPNNSSTVTTTVVQAPSLSIAKQAALAPGSTGKAGDLVNYTFTATNTGNVALTGVTIADPLPGLSGLTYSWPGAAGSLQAGQSVTATATYRLTQADVDAGAVSNVATATGRDPGNALVDGGKAPATVTLNPKPALTMTKQAALAPGATGKAGDLVTYTFSATNVGDVTLKNVAISDPHAGLSALTYQWPGTPGQLAPGQKATATATYTITQADVDAGRVDNTASAAGTTLSGVPVDGGRASVSIPLTGSPQLSLTKTAKLAVGAQGVIGDRVEYTFTATNTGTQTLTNVTVVDQLAGMSALTYQWPGVAGVLVPGQSVTATATYTIAQKDVDAGSVNNVATATGRAPNGASVPSGPAQATVPLNVKPELTLTKRAVLTPGQTGVAGDKVQYTFTVTNTGRVTVNGVTISDHLAGLSALTYQWPGAAGVLQPGQTATATATYTLKQADVDAGSVSNVAVASGTTPTGAPVTSNEVPATVPLDRTASLNVTKTAKLATGQTGKAGDTVNYTFSATNTGPTTLTSVTITDPLPGLSALVYTWPGTPGTLAPGQKVTATATYTVKQADVDAGSVSNVAASAGKAPDGTPVDGGRAPATVPLTNTASLNIRKTATLAPGAVGKAGDTVNYTFSATNTGPTTLTNVKITDPLPGLSSLVYTWPGASGTLKPGETVNATATYTVKQADVDSGAVSNVAASTGRAPDGSNVDGGKAPATVPLKAGASLNVTKVAKLGDGATGKVGDTITYTFTSTNTGPTTLTGVTITDPLPGLSALEYNWPASAGVLAPGQKVTATATYVVKQADVDAGSVSNVASSKGTAPDGSPVDGGKAPATVPLDDDASLNVTKTAALAAGQSGKAGDTVNYTFSATNTGPTTLTGVVISDPLPGLSALTYTWPGAAGVLKPGQKVTATATYTVKQADVDSGAVSNVASSTGTAPDGSPVDGGRAPATVPLTHGASLNITKTGVIAAGQSGKAGDTVNYTFSATNTGPTTLTEVVIADPLPGLSAMSYSWPGVAGTLKPGQTVTATATYTVKQTDVDAGSISNIAASGGRAPDGSPVDGGKAPATVALPHGASLNIAKTAALASGQVGKAGDTVNYTFSATNTGATTLKNVVISDPLPGLSALKYTWPGTPGTLKPGQTVTATATYTVTQADADAGAVSNVAGSTGTAPDGSAVDGGKAPATVPLGATPTLRLHKEIASVTGGSAGDVVTYRFTSTNTGALTLKNVVIVDPLDGLSAMTYTWPGASGILKPGESVVATATYVIKQSDVDAGGVWNTAVSHGDLLGKSGRSLLRSSGSVDSNESSAELPLGQAPKLELTKTGALAAGATGKAGDRVSFSFTLSNPGSVSLTAVSIADQLPGLSAITYSWPGAAGALSPGQTATATASYTLTQADVDAGKVTNIATASSTDPSGDPVDSDPAQADVPLTGAPSIALVKTGALAAGATGKAGDAVNFAFTATNTGTTTLTAVTIEDRLPAVSALAYSWPGAAGTLAPGQKVTATATYALTQVDIDAGRVTNVAVPHSTAPDGSPVDGAPAQAVVPVTPAPALTLTKTGALAAGATGKAGDAITFGFTITNTGSVTASSVAITDQLAGLSAITYTWPASAGALAPGQSASGTATYTVRQADVDAGSVLNVATAAGKAPDGSPIPTGPAQVSVPLQATPALTLVKTGALAAGATGVVGDRVQFSFTVTNSGSVTATGVSISDQLAGLSAITYTWPAAAGTLAPGQSATATASYTLKQADLDAGSVKNVATATGKTPSGSTVTAPPAQVEVPVDASPALTLVKTGALAPGATGAVGDRVQFSFTVTNSGSVTATGVSISDQLAGLSAITYTWPAAAGTLAPGQSATATASYTLKQADLDAGSVKNAATASAKTPTGSTVTAPPAQVEVPVDASPALTLVKTGALAAGATGAVGDTVTFRFTVTNSGTATAAGVSISDQLAGVSAITYTWPATAGVLAPGASVQATATYALTQADIDAGSVTNVATATGSAPDGSTIEAPPAQVVVPVAGRPALTVTKTGALAAGATGAAGDSVSYRITATNSGTVTLTAVTISDELAGLSALQYAWPGSVGVLAPGQAVTATASYTVTQADVDAGSVLNVASASGTDPRGNSVPGGPAQTVVPLAPTPALSLAKSSALAAGATGVAGDTVDYTFTMRNTGTVTLTSVTVTDGLAGLSAIVYTWPGAAGILAPGEQATGTATYVLTQADVDAGAVANTATATGKTPQGETVPATPAEAVVSLDPAPGLAVVKKAALAPGATGGAGDTVRYTFTVTNTGGVTLTSVAVDDQLDGMSALDYAWPAEAGVLAPGQSATATASYTISQADVDAGSVTNLATGVGTGPRGDVVDTPPAEAVVPLNPTPGLALTKTAVFSADSDGSAGDAVEYTFSVTNTGGVTLDGVSISDQLTGMSVPVYSWPGAAGVLAPGQSATARATYIVTAADVEAGSVDNVATATGRAPSGSTVTSPEAHAAVPLAGVPLQAGTPGMDLTKSGSLAEGALGQVGDLVHFTFVVTNTGTVPLTSVSISDPLDGISPLQFGAWPGAVGRLEPGQAVTATATYALTPDDVARGSVVNTAFAHGTHEETPLEAGSNTVTVPLPPQAFPSGGQPMVAATEQAPVFDMLAHTGLDALPFGFGALALLLAGGVLLLIRRRARES